MRDSTVGMIVGAFLVLFGHWIIGLMILFYFASKAK